MDNMEKELDPEEFFRISRGCIVSRRAVQEISRYLNGRLKLKLLPPHDKDILVARPRSNDFVAWLG